MPSRHNVLRIVANSVYDFRDAPDASIGKTVANAHLFIHVNRNQPVGPVNSFVMNKATRGCGEKDENSDEAQAQEVSPNDEVERRGRATLNEGT